MRTLAIVRVASGLVVAALLAGNAPAEGTRTPGFASGNEPRPESGTAVPGIAQPPPAPAAAPGTVDRGPVQRSGLPAGPAPRAVPASMPFQGYLQDAGGAPVTGPVTITARMFDAPSGGTLLWGPEAHPGVAVEDGVFDVPLGGLVALPLGIFGPSALYLEIQVNAEPPMPRTPILTTPFAMRAGIADVADVAIADDGDWTFNGPDLYTLGAVGIGTTAPGAPLHVRTSGIDVLHLEAPSDPLVRLQENGFGRAFLQSFDDDLYVGTYPGATDVVLYPGLREALRARENGQVDVGGPAAIGRLFVRNGAAATGSSVDGNVGGFGGGLYLREENGAPHTTLEPDFNGSGAFLSLATGGAGSFQIDGNSGGSGHPRLVMTGLSSAVLNMNATGDVSVALPLDAISDFEILDEPGLAFANNDGTVFLTGGGTTDVIASRSITVPTSGYVMVSAGCYISGSAGSSAVLGLSETGTSFAIAQDVDWSNPTTSGLLAPAHFSTVFDVVAGTRTFSLLGVETAGTVNVADISLTVLFVPTAYGSVSPAGAIAANESGRAPEPPLSPAAVAAERLASAEGNAARVAAELADMRSRLAELEAQLATANSR